MTAHILNEGFDCDIVIVGGGPAAIQQYSLLQKRFGADLRVVMIAEKWGGWARILGPQLMQSTIDELNIGVDNVDLRKRVPFERSSPTGLEYSEYLIECLQELKPLQITGDVTDISSGPFGFRLQVNSIGPISAKKVILCTGIAGKLREWDYPGFHFRSIEQAYEDVSGNQFEHYLGKKVVVLGSGNSAMQIAGTLAAVSTEVTIFAKKYPGFFPTETSDRFAWRGETQRTSELVARSAQKSKNGKRQEYRIRFLIYDSVVHEAQKTLGFRYSIEKNQNPLGRFSLPDEKNIGYENIEFVSDGVFHEAFDCMNVVFIVATGVEAVVPGGTLCSELERTQNGFIWTDDSRQTSVEDIFAIGGCMGSPAINFIAPADKVYAW